VSLKSKWSQHVLFRKGNDFAQQLPRAVKRIQAKASDFSSFPPVLVNSFPKSGTHLLLQIAEALPNTRDYGTFWASMPSYTFRERSVETMKSALDKVIPGELVSSHLFYDPVFSNILRAKNTVHYFIYRDPRDIVISEAHYLASMTKWHRLHPYFKALPSVEAQISFSIQGANAAFPYDYPNIAERFKRYQKWLDDSNVMTIKFEDLVSAKRDAIIQQMIDTYGSHCHHIFDRDRLFQKALHNIDPHRSHTFRQGKSGGWRKVLTTSHQHQIKEVAGELLIELGYENDFDW
jgi:sulfotransferase 6B1